MKEKARKIAEIIESVDTDFRGNLLQIVAMELYKDAQGYTGKVITMAADAYGINPEDPSTTKQSD